MSPPSSSSSSSFEVVVGGGAAVSSNLGGWTVQDLSYQDMAVDETGAVLSRDRKERLRLKHGYCPTCPTIPIQLYTMKRSRLNPLWSSKTPRSVEAECHNGMCLKCCGSSASSSTAATTNAAAAAARSRSVSSLPTIQSSSSASPLLHAPSVSSGASFRSTATAATTTTTSPEATSSSARAPRSHTMTTTNHHPSSHAHSHRHPASLPQSPPMKRTGTRRIGGTRHSTSRGGGALVPPPPWALEEEGEESSHSSNSSPTTPVSSATTNKKNKDTCNPSLNDSLSTTSWSSRFTMPSLVPAASVSTTITDSTTTATSTATTTHSPTSEASTTTTTVLSSSSPVLHSRSTHSVRNNSPTTGGPASSSSFGGSSSRSLLLSSSSSSLRSMNSSSHHTHNAASTTTTTTMNRQSTRTNMMIREASVRSAVSTLSDGPSYHNTWSSNHTTPSSHHHPQQHTTGELGGRQASTQSLELVPHHHSSKEHDDWMESATNLGGSGGGHESLSTLSEWHLSCSNHTSPSSVLWTNKGRSMEQEQQDHDTNKNHTDPQELFPSLQDDDDNDEKQSPQDQHHDKEDPQDYPHVAQVVLDDLQSLVHQLVLASSWTVLANVLANAMKQHTSYHAAVARFCLSTLAEYYGHGGDGGTPTANHEQEQQQPQGSIQLLWHVQVDKWLVHAMKQHPHDPVVQEQACRLAHCLLLAPDDDDDNNHSYHQDWLVQAQLPWYLYQAMRQFGTESVAVAIHGMAVARSLSIHATARSVWNDISRQDSGGASSSSSCGFVFVQVMHHHPTVAQVQRDACALLNNLAVDLEQYHVSTVPPDTLQGVLVALQNHATHDDNNNNNKSSSVVSSALFALQNLTYNDTNLGTLCRLPNVCRILHQVVTHDPEDNHDNAAQMLLERVQFRQTQDLSLEQQALESLQAHIQLKQDDPQLLVDVLAVCDAHSWSQPIVSTGLKHIGQVVTSSSSSSSSREQQMHHFLREETALSRVQAHLVTFVSDPVVAPTAQAILEACASDKHK